MNPPFQNMHVAVALPNTPGSYAVYGAVCARQFVSARAEYRDVLSDLAALIGPDHEHLRSHYALLAHWDEKQRKLVDAAEAKRAAIYQQRESALKVERDAVSERQRQRLTVSELKF